ncbi:LOW QUALITY PROTEIN: axin-1-like [Lampetra fluviatilis]
MGESARGQKAVDQGSQKRRCRRRHHRRPAHNVAMDKKGHALSVTAFPLDAEGNLMEDAPRPPVPGKEDRPRAGCRIAASKPSAGNGASAAAAERAAAGAKWCTPRRHDYDLGFEPEGSASAAAPYARCGETLPALLGDPDGAHLLRAFLHERGLVDLVDFWFACKGLRKQPRARTARAARAIYKRYVADVGGVVASRLKPSTRSAVREAVLAQAAGGAGGGDCGAAGGGEAAFDRAQGEVQRCLEEAAYPAFLRSDAYLRHALAESAGGKDHGKVVLLVRPPNDAAQEEQQQQQEEEAAAPVGTEWTERGFGGLLQSEPLSVATSCRYDPANSVNDSECAASSGGTATDDGASVADSASVRYGAPDFSHRAPPHAERTRPVSGGAGEPLHPPWAVRVPRVARHSEPAVFAAELIRRLNSVQMERHCQHQPLLYSQKQQQQQHQEEEERQEEEEETVTMATLGLSGASVLPALHPFALLLRAGADADDDPERILDQHVSRVLRTPVVCRSPTSRPHQHGHQHGHQHHHQHHHHAAQAAAVSGRALPVDRSQHGATAAPFRKAIPAEEVDRARQIWQWLVEGERDGLGHVHSELVVERPWGPPPRRRVAQPNHPFLQDPSMPPPPPPNTTVQLEEAKRRLEEEQLVPLSRSAQPGKHKYVQEVIERGRCLARGVAAPITSAVSTVPDAHPAEYGRRTGRRLGARGPGGGEEEEEGEGGPAGGGGGGVVVAYYFCGEPIPYRSRVRGDSLTLAHFKELLTKKGNYRFYFKKASEEFECGVVFEEVRDDKAPLPLYQGKVVGKVEKVEGGSPPLRS